MIQRLQEASRHGAQGAIGPPVAPRSETANPDRDPYVWRTLAITQVGHIVDAFDLGDPLHDEPLEIAGRKVPYYDPTKTTLIRMRKVGSDQPYRFYLSCEDGAFHLNGTSPPVHQANRVAGLQLNEETAPAYTWFFTYFVRGEQGAFYVLTDADDPMLPRALLDDPVVPLGELIRPPVVDSIDKKGSITCRVQIIYGTHLFAAEMVVHQSGMVEMADDEPLITELAAPIHAPIG